MRKLGFVVITGMSGAGKTQAANLLEDIAFYCVDNLPPPLIPQFATLCAQTSGNVNHIGLVIDVREGKFLDRLMEMLDHLRRDGHRVMILFLDARDEVLIRRFSETRRPHPLALHGSLVAGIETERKILAPLQREADLVIDTSDYTVHEFRKLLLDTFRDWERPETNRISLVSFGYKFGLPHYADIIFDLRFLPNPHFVEELKTLTGRDQPVIDFIMKESATQSYLNRLVDFLDFCLPLHIQEGKYYLTVGLGCTGGRHRSVALVEYLGHLLRKRGYAIHIYHRDIDR